LEIEAERESLGFSFDPLTNLVSSGSVTGMTDYINFKTLKRPPKPNTCLVAPDDYCLAADPDFAPPTRNTSAPDLFSKLSEMIAAQKPFSRVESDANKLRLKFIATTGLLRFKDDVDIEIIPVDDDHATLAIYSRSRVGYSDLGANQKRVSKLISDLTTN